MSSISDTRAKAADLYIELCNHSIATGTEDNDRVQLYDFAAKIAGIVMDLDKMISKKGKKIAVEAQ